MPSGVADILEVVVFSTGTYTALRCDRTLVFALVGAEKHILELHHAGIGKQQRRIVAGDERGTRHNLVAALAEKLEERPPQLVAGHGFHNNGFGMDPTKSMDR